MNHFDRIANKIVAILPERLTGSAKDISTRYYRAFAAGSPERLIAESRLRTAKMYLLIAVLLVLIIMAIVADRLGVNDVTGAAREPFGGNASVLRLAVKAEYGGEQIEMPATVKVMPRAQDVNETQTRIDELKRELPKLITQGSGRLGNVTDNLDLPAFDKGSGIEIAWESERPDIVDDHGVVNMIVSKPGDKVVLTAHFRAGEVQDSASYAITIGKPSGERAYAGDLKNTIDSVIANLSKAADGNYLKLPKISDGGVKLTWRNPQNSGLIVALFVVTALAFIIYKKRYTLIDTKIHRAREDIRRDFPEFISKQILLLGAGLVITETLTQITGDYRARIRPGEERALYEELCGIKSRMSGSNTTLMAEFADMARRSGLRELMRYSAILNDNIDKGTELAEKLTRESEMLWVMRKKDAESKGKIAETKLTFPMALQLLAVIIITVAPATISMQ